MDVDYVIKYVLCLYIIFGPFVDIPSTVPQMIHKLIIITLLVTALVFTRYDFVTSILICVSAIIYVGKVDHTATKTIISKFTKNPTFSSPPPVPHSATSHKQPPKMNNKPPQFKKIHSRDITHMEKEAEDTTKKDPSDSHKKQSDEDMVYRETTRAIHSDRLQRNEVEDTAPSKVTAKGLHTIQNNVFDNLNYKLHYTELGDQHNIHGVEDHGVSGFDASIYM